MKTDLFGNIPKVGDIIIFNPPYLKGLIYGECIGFTKAGLPKVINCNSSYSVKTDFVIK